MTKLIPKPQRCLTKPLYQTPIRLQINPWVDTVDYISSTIINSSGAHNTLSSKLSVAISKDPAIDNHQSNLKHIYTEVRKRILHSKRKL